MSDQQSRPVQGDRDRIAHLSDEVLFRCRVNEAHGQETAIVSSNHFSSVAAARFVAVKKRSRGDAPRSQRIVGHHVVGTGDWFLRIEGFVGVRPMARRGAEKAVPASFVFKDLRNLHLAKHPPRYKPIRAEDFVAAMLAEAYRTGLPALGAKTAERLRDA